MAQHQFLISSLILFSLFLTNKAVTAANNAQNSYSGEVTTMSTVPVPNSQGDDFQEMLEYLNQTVPKDDPTGSSNDAQNFDKGTISQGAPSPSQLVSGGSLHDASYVHSGKEAQSSGSYIRAGTAIASAIFVGHFFL